MARLSWSSSTTTVARPNSKHKAISLTFAGISAFETSTWDESFQRTIYIFATEFIDDVLYSATPYAYTGADGIHLLVEGGHGDFSSVTRLSSESPYFDDVFADFRHFQFK